MAEYEGTVTLSDEEIARGYPAYMRDAVREQLKSVGETRRREMSDAVMTRQRGGSGFAGRVNRIANGFGSAANAPLGLVKDLAVSPFTDDDIDGILPTIYRAIQRRGGEVLGGALGPGSGFGAYVGAFPDPIRAIPRTLFTPLLEASEFVYREGIAEPVTTAMTQGSRADVEGWETFLSPSAWRESYKVAQTRSPGQAVALAVGTEDITDPNEVAKFVGTDAYEVISGTTDAIFRWYTDPTVAAGVGLRAARVKHVVRPIRSPADIDKAMTTTRVQKFLDRMEGLSASEIRHRYFPEHAQGDPIAAVLADAEDKGRALRALMGDMDELDRLHADQADVAGRIARLMDTEHAARSLKEHGFELPKALGDFEARKPELDTLYDEQARLERIESAHQTLTHVPRAGMLDDLRADIVRSDFYQKSPFAAPLRVSFNMRPGRYVNLHSPMGSVHVWRLLQKSDLDVDAQDAIRSEFMAAATPEERLQVVVNAEDAAVRSIAEKAGMTRDDVENVLAEAGRLRGQAKDMLNSRVYDGEGRSRLQFQDEDGVPHDLPLMETQTADLVPMVDLDQVRKATKTIGRYRMQHPKTNIPGELLTSFYKLWRPSVLLRVGWPLRIVTDEQLRIFAKIGVLAQMKNLKRGFKENIEQRLAGIPKKERIPGAQTIEVSGYEFAGPFAGDTGEVYRGLNSASSTLRSVLARDENGILQGLRREAGEWQSLDPTTPGYSTGWEQAVNLQIGQSAIARKFLQDWSVDEVVEWLAGRPTSRDAAVPEGSIAKGALVRAADRNNVGRVVGVDEATGTATVHFVNRQEGSEATVTLPLGDLTPAGSRRRKADGPAEIGTEGQRIARRLRFRRDHRAWATAVRDQVESYTLGNPELKQLALRRQATMADLERIEPNASLRPIVHGEVLAQAIGTSVVVNTLQKVVDRSMNALGRVPSDVLSRNRFFDHMYRAEVERLTDLLDAQRKRKGTGLGQSDLNRIEQRARDYALAESKRLLYDLAEQSELAHVMRFLMPFYSAWQEVITRWGGLAVENPAFVARARLIWNAPEKAGLVYDENGHRVDENGVAFDHNGRRVKAGTERYLNVRLPEWARDVPGLRTVGDLRLNKKGFNMVLQGLPGFGPLVQLPVNEIVKGRPELEEAVRWALPFGTTQDWRNIVMPATAKRIKTATGGEDDRQYRNSVLRIYFDSIVDFNLGKRDTKPTYDEAKRKADDFWKMRTAASFLLPVAPQFTSPYQVYIDAYRQLREEDPENADARFLDLYGEEFFPLTQSLSKSMDGVPPTLQGAAARKRYEDMIEQYPELGGLIVGAEGAGEFSRAVYDAQLASNLAPGSEFNQRESPAFAESSVTPDVRLGWIKYRKYMDLIDAARVARGVPNLRVKAAADLAALKQAFTEKVAADHPAWFEDFGTFDRTAWDRKLAGMREITADKKLSGRPDIAGLSQYLRFRDLITASLATREHKTIDAASNADLDLLWESITAQLVERNPAFGALYHRWLSNDRLEAA